MNFLMRAFDRVQAKTKAAVLLEAIDKKNEIIVLLEAISHELEDANYYKWVKY